MNISNNLISCPLCKNIFLKTHIKIHYQNCKSKKPTKIVTEKKISQEVYKKKEEPLFNELRVDNYIKPEIITYNDSMLNYFFKEF